MNRALRAALLAGLLSMGAGCALLERGETSWVSSGPIVPSRLPGWARTPIAPLLKALTIQCQSTRYQRTANAKRTDQRAACALITDRAAASEPPFGNTQAEALREQIANAFMAWPVVSPVGSGLGLLTGYHEPEVTGSRRRENERQAPLYALPSNMAAWRPGPSREQIDANPAAYGLRGRALVWLDDPVEAFFLQIQGSGRVLLRNGQSLRIGYAGNNGQPYVAIGKTLLERGLMERSAMSADAIKAWLRANPELATEILQTNPRVVFFREIPNTFDGPIGALGLPLTGRGSLAVDLTQIPGGALLYGRSWQSPTAAALSHPIMAVAQDTGSAIQGAVRADWFTGSDARAARLASGLNAPLRLWLLWPKASRPPGRLPLAWSEPLY